MSGHTVLVIIYPVKCEIKWIDHLGCLQGEEKVISFLARLMRDMDIPENPLLEVQEKVEDNLFSRIFCCNEFNNSVKE